jgi:hypothetical protein
VAARSHRGVHVADDVGGLRHDEEELGGSLDGARAAGRVQFLSPSSRLGAGGSLGRRPVRGNGRSGFNDDSAVMGGGGSGSTEGGCRVPAMNFAGGTGDQNNGLGEEIQSGRGDDNECGFGWVGSAGLAR